MGMNRIKTLLLASSFALIASATANAQWWGGGGSASGSQNASVSRNTRSDMNTTGSIDRGASRFAPGHNKPRGQHSARSVAPGRNTKVLPPGQHMH